MKSFTEYQNPALAVDLVVFGYHENELYALLLNRNTEPFKNRWTLPGAFLQMNERFQEACDRVLKTKLGMSNLYMEQLYSFDQPERDPRGRAISVTYYAIVNPRKFEIAAGIMANDVKWHKKVEMPRLAFDHETIFKTAFQRLRAKILYHPVGFQLLDDIFTMPELHGLYETILGIEIDRRNFRRKILDSGYIIATGERREGLQNRHPDLYKFNKKLKPNQFNINIDLS
jgi:8-oxo-dGTP diphosphatase